MNETENLVLDNTENVATVVTEENAGEKPKTFTQEEVDEICEFIYSVKKVNKFDNNIRNIINEEAQSFFEGQKSAQEVAQIIQSRAQIFVDENR